jgi:predicted metal-dependent HD superfamily phosphohydrolase
MLLELTRRYTEVHRHYHDIRHIAQMLAWGKELRLDDAQVLAVWLHDAVYDPRSASNEDDSAALARQLLPRAGHGPDVVERVAGIVLDTKQHVPSTPASAAVLDLDLASLALPWPEFRANSEAIRREFAHLEEAEFQAGRRRFMAGLLARDRLFFTPWGEGREAAARANIARLLRET